ncbi:hypothetical protein LSTR_LSTR000234 [Laodelphax striatellus]|uniref:Secreted protein n=1 Tax=Laodelphax striatellus TaxID=195883 RepID=A0A482X7V6_LAOST|nr:hypothetical protein LSTR_LSTR000234 [Laodelphax striatellus]
MAVAVLCVLWHCDCVKSDMIEFEVRSRTCSVSCIVSVIYIEWTIDGRAGSHSLLLPVFFHFRTRPDNPDTKAVSRPAPKQPSDHHQFQPSFHIVFVTKYQQKTRKITDFNQLYRVSIPLPDPCVSTSYLRKSFTEITRDPFERRKRSKET